MKRVLIVTFDGGAALDATGPAEVFGGATDRLGERAYDVQIVSVSGGAVALTAGIRIETRDVASVRLAHTDTVLFAGGPEASTLAAMGDAALLAFARRAAKVVERIGSVCSGAFVLAAAGVLDGRRATTHWLGCERLTQMFPRVKVDPNAIFVADGRVWTSAGVTTGIDMALAMVENDHGPAAANALAASLVLYVRRPGFQSQFSDGLVAQLDSADPFRPVVAWIRAHLKDADVESVARASGLSVRTLHRRCLEHLRMTPAKLVDKLRVEHARTLLATSDLPAKNLAALSGFGSATHLRRAFERELGMAPRDYRLFHQRAD